MRADPSPGKGRWEDLQGVIPPLILPLTDQGQLDLEGLERQIGFLLDAGVQGLWVNGSTGEFFALSAEERQEVVQACVETVGGRFPVIAQVGDCATRQVLRHARGALDAGADGLSVVLPYYVVYTQQELAEHYRSISRELGRELFLYQLPQLCKVSLDVPRILELAEEGVLAGVKDSAGDVDFYSRLVRRVRETGSRLRCFYGASSLVDVGLYAGGDGVMCAVANLVPGLCCRIFQAALQEDWKTARRLNERIRALLEALALPGRTTWVPVIAAYKYLLRELGLIGSDRVFAPLQPLSEEEKARLRQRALPLITAPLP